MLEAFLNIHSDKSKAKEMQRSLHNGRKSLQSKNRSPQNCQKLAKGPSKKKKKKECSYWKTDQSQGKLANCSCSRPAKPTQKAK